LKKIAFVIPWYGENISGGAESACRNIAERIAEKGEQVEVLTTCVKQFNSDWNQNYYNPGEEFLNGVKVKRFKVRKRDVGKFDEINQKLMENQNITPEEEEIFLDEMVNSRDLETYILKNKHQYKAIIFTPYMFGTTYNGIQQAVERSILLPAFHDESYAYFQSFRQLYSKVKGIIFFSDAEKEWANENYILSNINQKVLGLGIKNFKSNPDDFKAKFNINFPFILYAGRKDRGKNVHLLLDYFSRYHKQNSGNELRLVLIGGGQIEIPQNIKKYTIDLGFLDEQDKYNAYGAAEFLCNPSAHESFSIVIMESWYSGRPVLVYGGCNVTKRFCEESNGGLYFSNFNEFQACTDLILSNQMLSNSLGKNGRSYVQSTFEWDCVINNYIKFINQIAEESEYDQPITTYD
jgi:glycosyltransferase involved in cell wall biosynthesis